MSLRFPYALPSVTQDDLVAAAHAIELPNLTQGKNLEAFESALAETFGVRHVVACNSGTAALHLAYLALGLAADKGLVTSPLTFLATANAARMCGAPVAFADTDPATGNVTAAGIEAALQAADFKVAAIAPVHLGGRPCDMPAIRALADAAGCVVMEDACHAPLAIYLDHEGERFPVGACAHSDVAIFSFHAIKHLTMGEGGALCTNDDEIADRARLFRNHGLTRMPQNWRSPPETNAPWYYEMHELGWNYRASELQCALGLGQLARLEDGIARRRVVAAGYAARLGELAHVTTPPPPPIADGHVWHLYPVAIDFASLGRSRGTVMMALAERGVGSQVHYIPLYRQPYYADSGAIPLPGAEAYYAASLSIPMYPQLGEEDLDFIVGALREVLGG